MEVTTKIKMNGSSALDGCKIGFLGGGNMARAIVTPLLAQKIIMPDRILVSAQSYNTRAYWKQTFGIQPVENNSDLVRNSQIIFLATKPKCLETAIKQIFDNYDGDLLKLYKDKLFVSVAAGVTLDTLKQIMSKYGSLFRVKMIRTMPNLPLSVLEGITLYCRNENVSENDAMPVVEMFSHLGIIEEIDESLMDVAGGLAGCGPAYGYVIIEALADGVVKLGLSRALAMKFAAQVLIGAGKMVIKTGKHPGQLKDEVCSPGGTTIAGIHQLEIGSVRATMMNAVEASINKSKELGSMTIAHSDD